MNCFLPQSNGSQVATLNAPTIRLILEAFGFDVVQGDCVRLIIERRRPENSGGPAEAQVRADLTPDRAAWSQRVTRIIK
jgi:hypothetical protein